MRLYEHEAKAVFAAAGLRVPARHGLIRQREDLAGMQVRYPAMVKVQTLVGGRGKAGGIRKVGNSAEATEALSLLDLHVGGYPTEALLVEGAEEATGACYLGVTVNPASSNSVVLASASGGVDIEEVARTRPEAILRRELEENPAELPEAVAREVGSFLAEGLGEPGRSGELAEAAKQLYRAYQEHDCKVAEINPLLVTAGGVVAADAKIVLDDNALYRQGRLLQLLGVPAKRHDVAEPTARERRAAKAGFFYVDLLPEDAEREEGKVYVGLVPGGAGYGIFSIDEVTNVGERHFGGRLVPVNFMDSGGGPTRQAVAEMFELLLDNPLVDLIVTSRFGGISSCDVFIRGLVDCLRRRAAEGKRVVPIYGRMVGTDLASGRAFLEAAIPETPEELEPLSMVVGNQRIMAEVIRQGVEDYLAKAESGGRTAK